MAATPANGSTPDELDELRGEWDEFRGNMLAEVGELHRRDDRLAELVNGTRNELIGVMRTTRLELLNAISAVRELLVDPDKWRDTTAIRHLRAEKQRAEEAVARAEDLEAERELDMLRARRRGRMVAAVVAVGAPAAWEILRNILHLH